MSRPPLKSDESVVIVLRRIGPLNQGVTVAKRLVAAGATLKQAHAAINQLATTSRVVCSVAGSENLAALAMDLAVANVELRRPLPMNHSAADIAKMRTRHGLSQREYADLLGVDIRTLQNWEQGRNRPDPAAVSLMRVFAMAPDVVEDALTEKIA